MLVCTRSELGKVTPLSQSILILGPHRSGTSAVTRVLNLLGVELGREMLTPKFDNQRGYWEHRAVFELHERLLSAVGSAWHDYLPLPLGWRELEEVESIQDELRSVLEEELLSEPLWGVKDPRLCRLLPVWLDLLDELATEAAFVIVVRNPLEVARSLERRNQFSFSKCLLLYLAEMLAAIRHTEGRRRGFVSFARLLEDWKGVVADLSRELQVEWPKKPEECAAEIEDFLEPSERHYRYSPDDLSREPRLPEWGSDLYRALEAASRGRGEDLATAWRKARDAYREAAGLFGPEIRALEREIAGFSDRVETLESRDAELESARLERRVERAEAELEKVQEHLTSILSSPLYRSTRPLRRALRALGRLRS